MKILITGKDGQVGYELERSLQGLGAIIAADRQMLDLSNFDQIRRVVREVKPNLIINAAAYTAVDRAETESELAMKINGIAPGILAEEAKLLGSSLIHYSTDYVFDGKNSSAYIESDPTCPVNMYGNTKLAGEKAVSDCTNNFLIFRTSWVYGTRGKNFLQTMLRLARDRDELRVVNDQHGAPTWSRTIADSTAHVVAMHLRGQKSLDTLKDFSGVYHLTSQGKTTWYEFTRAILENAGLDNVRVTPISSAEFPLPAARPTYSYLSTELFRRTFCDLPDWRSALNLCQRI